MSERELVTEALPSASVVICTYNDGPYVARCIDFTIISATATGGLRRGRTPLARYSPSGCNLAVRRSILDEVGLFDERRSARALPVIASATAVVHIRYGSGFLLRALTNPFRQQASEQTP